MIRLERCAPPVELTNEKIRELTNLYLAEGKNVWNVKFIKDQLLAFSFGKCCYCECRVDELSAYLEVEHFLPKKIYPEKVVEWKNLLPSCKRCNGEKGEHDTFANPIVNPTIHYPNDHLYLKAYRFYAKDELGSKTIDVINLNDRARKLTQARFQIGEAICERLNEVFEQLQEHQITSDLSPKKLRNIKGIILSLLTESTPAAEYSATAATALFSSENKFDEIKQQMILLQLWEEEMELLEIQARNGCLFP